MAKVDQKMSGVCLVLAHEGSVHVNQKACILGGYNGLSAGCVRYCWDILGKVFVPDLLFQVYKRPAMTAELLEH